MPVRSHLGLGPDRASVLWRAGGPDRGDAPHSGRGKALAGRRAVPACAQLLDVAARPRGATVGHLCRLADAWHAGCGDRRRAVHPARGGFDHGAELDLRGVGGCRAGLGAFLRAQGGNPGNRAPGGGAGCPQGAQERADAAHRGFVVHRHIRACRAVSPDCRDGGADRVPRRTGGAGRLCGRRRAWGDGGRACRRCRDVAWRGGQGDATRSPARRPHRRACCACALACSGHGPFYLAWPRQRLCRHRAVLLQDGRSDLRRRLCRARLCGAGGGGHLWLAGSW